MLNLINLSSENIAWVETGDKKIFGIVNAFEVLDCDGLKEEGSVVDIFDYHTVIEQDWENEANIISFVETNGESSKLHITADGVELIDDNA